MVLRKKKKLTTSLAYFGWLICLTHNLYYCVKIYSFKNQHAFINLLLHFDNSFLVNIFQSRENLTRKLESLQAKRTAAILEKKVNINF